MHTIILAAHIGCTTSDAFTVFQYIYVQDLNETEQYVVL